MGTLSVFQLTQGKFNFNCREQNDERVVHGPLLFAMSICSLLIQTAGDKVCSFSKLEFINAMQWRREMSVHILDTLCSTNCAVHILVGTLWSAHCALHIVHSAHCVGSAQSLPASQIPNDEKTPLSGITYICTLA